MNFAFLAHRALLALLVALLSACSMLSSPDEDSTVDVQPVEATAAPVSTTVEEPVVEEPAEGKIAEVIPPPDAAPETDPEDVIWIQQRLQELGYYDGSVDGSVGQGTKDAVKTYQQDQGLTVDGQPSAKLRKFMWRNGG